MDLSVLNILYNRINRAKYFFWCLVSFVQHNFSKSDPYYQYLNPFDCQIIFHCIEIYFIYSFSLQTLGCLHFWAVINNSAMNFHIQAFVWTFGSNSLGYIPKNEIFGLYNSCKYNILTSCQFSKITSPSYIPTNNK